MPDQFTQVTSESWFGRIGNSIKGILVGIILIPVSIFLLYWNEGRAVTTAKSLKEGAGAVVSVDFKEVSPSNDQKLVHMSGDVTTADTVTDPDFAVSGNVIRMVRKVDMYQWKETKKSETNKKLGGGTETVTTYTYDKAWSDDRIDSSHFEHPEGHVNPTQKLAEDFTMIAPHVTIGAFKVPPLLIGKMTGDEVTKPGEADLGKLSGPFKSKAKLSGDGYYFGKDPSVPAIGDQRVTFKVLKPATFSLLAQQVGDSFGPYPTKAGDDIARVESGTVSAAAMFKHAESENAMITWILRLVGFVLMSIGFSMIISPIVVFADVIPFLGNIIGVGVGFAAFLLGFVISLITIAIAWFVVRPVLGCVLLAIAIGGIVFGKKLGHGRAAAKATPQVA